jgi:hypothetical protein
MPPSPPLAGGGATFKREQLMDKFGIQINKTSRNTVLFMTNISPQILEFMRSLDTPEVHGYDPQAGYRVYTAKALEIAQEEQG